MSVNGTEPASIWRRMHGVETIADELLDQALAERRALVQLCLYALDRRAVRAWSQRIEEGLSSIGVVALRPDGERFDPSQHEAGGTVPDRRPDVAGPGRRDRGASASATAAASCGPPIVTVYTAGR